MQEISLKVFPLSSQESMTRLEQEGIEVNEFFSMYLEHPAYQACMENGQLEILIASLQELGFDQPVTMPDLEAGLKEKGYSPLPAYTGIYLRLALQDQTGSSDRILSKGAFPDQAIQVFSLRLDHDDLVPRALYLRKLEDQLCLRACRFDDLYAFPIESQFAFQRRKA